MRILAHFSFPHSMPLQKRPRLKTRSSAIEDGLRRIYRVGGNESLRAMDIAERPIVRRILLWFLGALALLAVGLAVLIFFSGNTSQGASRDALTLAFSVPTDVISGKTVPVELTYKNQSTRRLVNVDLGVHLPNAVQFTSATPSPSTTEPLLWQLPSIAPGEQGVISLLLVPLLEPSFSQVLQANARFQPEHLNVRFDALTSKPITSTGSLFSITSTQEERVLAEEEGAYSFTIASNNPTAADAYAFTLALPEGFRLAESQPKPQDGTLSWPLPALVPEKPYTIRLRGIFSSDQSGERSLTGSVVTTQNPPLTQLTQKATTQVLGTAFTISLLGNGQTGTAVLTPGDKLALSIGLKNTGEESAENAQVQLVVDNGYSRLDLNARTGSPLGNRTQNTISWGGKELTRLVALRPGEEALLDTIIPTLQTGADTITVRAIAILPRIGGIDSEKRISSAPLIVRLASNTTLTARGQYFDASGAAIGTGPMPPQVGQSTVYRLRLELVNPLHPIDQTIITAPLGAHAAWLGSISSDQGTISYDTVSGRVRWVVGTMPVSSRPLIASFDIRLTPTSEDLRHFATILGTATLNATDTVSQSSVQAKSEPVTTELPGDALAKDKGLVIEAPTVPSTDTVAP